MSRLSVAIVVQRYGADIGGGAEEEARQVAGVLREVCDVTVLTTCARDYRTWEDHYPPGTTTVDGVTVLRFPVPEPRDPAAFDALSARAYADPANPELGERWMRAQGPVAPGLLDHLRDRGGDYDAVVFQTYLYATTAMGIPLVADRSILVPTLHDEPPARLAVFDPVFAAARLIVFNTPEERDFARARFGVADDRGVVAGLGIDPPPAVSPTEFAATRRIGRPYVVCVGRLDPSKGTDLLVEAHRHYRERWSDGADLVLVGRGDMDLPDEPWLTVTGFVDETEKHQAIAGAAVVAAPSPYESLSIAQLDAWNHGRPTLANAASPVLVGQSRRSGGGLWFAGHDEYAVMLDHLVRNPAAARAIGRQGQRAVQRDYRWEVVGAVWRAAVDRVAGRAPASDPVSGD